MIGPTTQEDGRAQIPTTCNKLTGLPSTAPFNSGQISTVGFSILRMKEEILCIGPVPLRG